MDKPNEGPLTQRHGPYLRNVQPIGNGLFLCEAQRGTQGKGKVWYPAVIAPNPFFGDNTKSTYLSEHRWAQVGEVKVAQGKYQIAGTMKAVIYGNHADDKRRFIKGYFPDELEAVAFLTRTATELFK